MLSILMDNLLTNNALFIKSIQISKTKIKILSRNTSFNIPNNRVTRHQMINYLLHTASKTSLTTLTI